MQLARKVNISRKDFSRDLSFLNPNYRGCRMLLDSRKKFKRITKSFSSYLLKDGKRQIGQYDLGSEGDFP